MEPYRQVPQGVLNLLVINVLCFLGTMLVGTRIVDGRELNPIFELFALYPIQSGEFRPWQLLTHLFLHANFTHLFFNMFALWMFGRALEMRWGTRRFMTYYLVCGLGAAAIQVAVSLIDPTSVIGASGAVFGVLLGFGMVFPNVRLIAFPIFIPIRARYAVIIYGALELFLGVTGTMSGIAHFAHLGGMIFGWLLLRYWKRTRKIYY